MTVEETVSSGSLIRQSGRRRQSDRAEEGRALRSRLRALQQRTAGPEIELNISEVDASDVTYRFRAQLQADGLVESIAERGQQEPVVVRSRQDGRYQLITGFRRVQALRALSVDTVLAFVRTDLSDEDAFALAFLDNQERRTLSDVDRGLAILRYRQYHPDVAMDRIAVRFGLKRSQAYRLLKLTTFPQVLQDAIVDGVVPSTHALAVMAQLRGADDDTIRGWIDRVRNERLSLTRLETLLREVGASDLDDLTLFHTADEGGERRFTFRPVTVVPSNLSQEARTRLIAQLDEVRTQLSE